MTLLSRFIALGIVLTLIVSSCAQTSQSQSDALAEMPPYRPEDDLPNHDWSDEELITIQGYSQDAMEIGISPDGRYLLFNDRNKPNKDMHWAERIDEKTYRYMGKVKNTISPTVDGTPSFDGAGNVYFTTTKSYLRDFKSIYVARFEDGAALSLTPVEGDIYITDRNKGVREMWISLDPDISSDGTLLFYSEGRFSPGSLFPYPFKVRGAERVNGEFKKIDDRFLTNVNSRNLEYAPAISDDGLELFFTRIAKVNGQPKMVGIYMAQRESREAPFSKPQKIMAITGEVEAPVLSGDENYLYYHRMDGGRFRVYRVRRNILKSQQS